MTNRDIVRDLIVYSITSVRYLLLKGHFNLFVKDLFYFDGWRNTGYHRKKRWITVLPGWSSAAFHFLRAG